MKTSHGIKAFYKFVKKVNIFSTIYWNYRLLPAAQARRLPLHIGYNVDIINRKRGAVRIEAGEIRSGMVRIGISDFPIYSARGLHTQIRFAGASEIIFRGSASIQKGCSIVASYGSRIEIGTDFLLNMNSLIYSNRRIRIGNHVRIGWSSQIYDTAAHIILDIATGEIHDPAREVTIGDNVWAANRVTIGPGAVIPPFTTVAACSLVNKDFSAEKTPGGILVGTPARYRAAGRIRILNRRLEETLKKQHFANSRETVNLSELGYAATPFDATLNPLYSTGD